MELVVEGLKSVTIVMFVGRKRFGQPDPKRSHTCILHEVTTHISSILIFYIMTTRPCAILVHITVEAAQNVDSKSVQVFHRKQNSVMDVILL